jgi:hypothetical protein
MPDPSETQWEHEWQLNQTYDNCVRLGSSYISWEEFTQREGQATDQNGFPKYAEALRERLARHGFTRPFQLDEDAARQDKITTWIEYLGYEYWWYNRYTGFVSSDQTRHDKAWDKLVDAKVLRPGETEEVICDIDTAFRDSSEEKRAGRAVQSAMSAVVSAEITMSKWQRSKLSPEVLQARLLAARSKLEMAQKEHESLKRRSDCITEFIQGTRRYQIAKDDAKRHELLLRWMLQQVPLIERELNPPNKYGSDKKAGTNMLKRKRLDELDENQQFQTQEGHEGASSSISDQIAPTAANSQPGKRRDQPSSKRRRRITPLPHNAVPNAVDAHSSTETFKISKTAPKTESRPQAMDGPGLRRSSRIAERAKRLNATTTTVATLVPAPTPSTVPKKQNGKHGRPRMASQRHTSKPQGISKKKGRTRL